MNDREWSPLRVRKISSRYFLLGVLLVFAGVLGIKPNEVNAACGWGIHADIGNGDASDYPAYFGCGQGKSKDETFRGESITNENGEKILKITLTDYHGGAIYAECCGTCSESDWERKAVVELVGKNTVTAEGGVGINLHMPVEFTGEGSLEITAMIPVGGGGLCGSCSQRKIGDACEIDMWGEQLTEAQKEQLRLTLGVHTLVIKPTIIEKEVLDEYTPTTDVGNDGPNSGEDAESGTKCPDKMAIENDSEGWGVWDIVAAVYTGISVLVFVGLAVRWALKHRDKKVSIDTADERSALGGETQEPEDDSKSDML